LQRHRRTLADFYGMAPPESGSPEGVSPELILVSEDDVAERARSGLAPIVPTDERLLAESSARIKAGLRVAAPARPEPAPIPVREAPPAVVAPVQATPAPAPPPRRRRRSRTGLRVAFAVALIPIAVVGAALGAGWNPVGGKDSSPPETQAAPPPPGHVGTATAHVTTAAPLTTHHTAPPAPSTHHRPAPTTARATPTAPTTHAATTRPAHHTQPARTTTPAPSTTRRAPTTAPATHPKPTPKPKPKPKPKPPQGPIKPSRVFAWPAAPKATFYLVRFLRGGVQVFSDRVTQPRLTLPARFVLKPGRYRWTVLPALGTRKNPQYGPPVVDSQFVVAG
jgi:hypothetical protein